MANVESFEHQDPPTKWRCHRLLWSLGLHGLSPARRSSRYHRVTGGYPEGSSWISGLCFVGNEHKYRL